ncbi:hypothetical protein CHU92_04555 [Flavobacterium cyanobacteriorum]|uniref:Cyclic nucleotide-binding domain-containing protein n=1 Tax=Flavobacterium cyanobacteriorum TaxID=2022802 RepID=A0A255ZI26_9FLAO|nr:Crp/Fnr family transcriptional regulator [Flavobacterium cyanobacteriorum]OYQ40554.1 hypothetical protein CHU92_04555 [Flavobacterium cyanobacteriorum]
MTTNLPDELINILLSFHPCDYSFLSELEKVAEPVFIPKKTEWVSTGKICNKVLFLQSGLLYSCHEEDNHTVTTWFMKENDFVISVKSFFLQQPSNESVIALEDCFGITLSFSALNNLIKGHKSLLEIYSKLIEKYYVLSEQRAINMRKKKAIHRYSFLLSHHPDIIRRVPLTLIASYLRVNIETLSRIRANI